MRTLAENIQLLREYFGMVAMPSSFGGMSGAHSYPGPEPGRVGPLAPAASLAGFSSRRPTALPQVERPTNKKKVRKWRRKRKALMSPMHWD
jgi:hypothetical protein